MCVCLAVSLFLKKKKILRSKDTNLLIFHNYGSGMIFMKLRCWILLIRMTSFICGSRITYFNAS